LHLIKGYEDTATWASNLGNNSKTIGDNLGTISVPNLLNFFFNSIFVLCVFVGFFHRNVLAITNVVGSALLDLFVVDLVNLFVAELLMFLLNLNYNL